MQIRKSNRNELASILKIYDSARQFMKENGNSNQWGDIHPDENTIIMDIENNHHFVCVDDNRLLGCFTFITGDDPTYKKIIKGKWLDNSPYAVIHRMALLEHGKGIGSICIEWCFNQHNNIRIDTHEDNIPMQRLLIKNGFRYCGMIYNEWGDERLAFHKVAKENL